MKNLDMVVLTALFLAGACFADWGTRRGSMGRDDMVLTPTDIGSNDWAIVASGGGTTNASEIGISDSGGNYASDTVEGAFAEIGADLADSLRFTSITLVHGSDTTDYTNNIAAAIAAAAAGDTLYVPVGTYDMGAGLYDHEVPFNIIGLGSDVSTIKTDGWRWQETATNCCLKGVRLLNDPSDSEGLVMFPNYSTNRLDILWDDVFLDGKSTSAGHVCEFAGSHIEIRNCKFFGHNVNTFVLKGASYVRVTDCESYIDDTTADIGLYIKSHPEQNGTAHHIVVDGFKSNGHIFIQPHYNDSCHDIEIYNYTEYAENFTPGSLFSIGNSQTVTNSSIYNLVIDGARGEATSIGSIGTGGVAVSNAVLRNIHVTGINYSPIYNAKDWTKVMLHNVTYETVFGGYGAISDEGVTLQKSFDRLSTGIDSTKVRVADCTSTGLWVVAQSGFELNEQYLSVGDPFYLSGGSYDGHFRLDDFGTTTADDFPITGAVSNDYYILLSNYSATTPSTNVNVGSVYAGKLAYQITTNDSSQQVQCIGNGVIKGGGAVYYSVGYYGAPGYKETAFNFGGPFYDNASAFTTSDIVDLAASKIDCEPHVFKYRGLNGTSYNLFAGVFGAASTSDSSMPNYFIDPYVVLNVKISETSPGNFKGGIVPKTKLDFGNP